MINKYQFNSQDFLCFGENMEFPEEFEVKLIEENCDVTQNKDLPIWDYTDLISAFVVPKLRTTDRVLFQNNITSYEDLRQAHVLNKLKESPFSRRIRDLIELKYANLTDHVLYNERESTVKD